MNNAVNAELTPLPGVWREAPGVTVKGAMWLNSAASYQGHHDKAYKGFHSPLVERRGLKKCFPLSFYSLWQLHFCVSKRGPRTPSKRKNLFKTAIGWTQNYTIKMVAWRCSRNVCLLQINSKLWKWSFPCSFVLYFLPRCCGIHHRTYIIYISSYFYEWHLSVYLLIPMFSHLSFLLHYSISIRSMLLIHFSMQLLFLHPWISRYSLSSSSSSSSRVNHPKNFRGLPWGKYLDDNEEWDLLDPSP